MKNLLLTIAHESGYKDPKNNSGISLELLIEGSLSGNVVSYVREATGCAKDTVTKAIRKAFPDRDPIHDRSLIKFLLSKRELKHCSSCKQVREKIYFYTNRSNRDGLGDLCKDCSKQARRDCYAKDPQKEIAMNSVRKRQRDILQTPSWANKDSIIEFYKNRPEGYHVDHIIPLNGETVCGLHILENLQYLPVHENLSKNNKYAP
ncbi:hypothetical protein EB118_13045 [bacterium]|nr:hypothetical protein [bacterium]